MGRHSIGPWAVALLLSAGGMVVAEAAQALQFTLDVEFDDGLRGEFADVQVVEEDAGLRFEIALLEPLGPDADLHLFYFNLTDGVPELALASDDPVTTEYVLSQSPPVAGGAGSGFDFGVSFGNGAGSRGNGVLETASFLILPTDPNDFLRLGDFTNAELSSASGGTIHALAAVHVQGTSLVFGADSETVGGVVPEPSTGLLLTAGLLLGLRRQRGGGIRRD